MELRTILCTFTCLMTAAAAASVAVSIPFEDCGSFYELKDVYVGGCTTAPCIVKIGSSIKVTSEFYAAFRSDLVQNSVFFALNNVHVYVKALPELCDSLQCPILAGDSPSYTSLVPVNKTLPALSGNLVWKLLNEDGDMVVCFKIAVKLTKATAT